MIDFEGGNAERPFVLGAHYNGEAKSGYHNADNRVKAIHTKSGHKLIFTEDESILLTDKNGNVIKLDTQGKNIEISAPETINITAKNINLKASDSIDLDASVNITETAGKAKRSDICGDMFVYVNGALTEVIEGDLHSETKKGKTMLNSGEGIETISEKNIKRNAKEQIKTNSGEKSKL
jgi:rhs element vgr protein